MLQEQKCKHTYEIWASPYHYNLIQQNKIIYYKYKTFYVIFPNMDFVKQSTKFLWFFLFPFPKYLL